jgi:hypothetical protein
MATTTVEGGEPKVSVHGIPQSQYNQQFSGGTSSSPMVATTPEVLPPPPGGSGLINNIKAHWQVWTVALAALTIVVMIVIYRLQHGQNAATGLDGSGNYITPPPSGSSGTIDTSGLDAEYNQLIALQNSNNATMSGILQAIQGGGTGTNGTPKNNYDTLAAMYSGKIFGQTGIPQGTNTADFRTWNPADAGNAQDTLHWDDPTKGIPIYSAPNSQATILKYSPFGSPITTYASWTAYGPAEYGTGTTWSAVQGGGFVPTFSLTPEAKAGQSNTPIFGKSSIPTTPFG